MLGSSRLCCESCCTASWWAAFTLCATHTVYCRGRRSMLGNDWRQNCCLLSNPSCSGISGDMSTATPVLSEENHEKNRVRWRPSRIPINRHNVTKKGVTSGGGGCVSWYLHARTWGETPPHSPTSDRGTVVCVLDEFTLGNLYCNQMRHGTDRTLYMYTVCTWAKSLHLSWLGLSQCVYMHWRSEKSWFTCWRDIQIIG